jgi:type II secretory pathway component PulM
MAKRDYKKEVQKLADALRNPMRLRLVVCGAAVAVAYFSIYGPLGDRIVRASRTLKEAEKRESTARDAEFLRTQVELFQSRLATNPDPNATTQYVLDGVRALPLKLNRLDFNGTVTVGPYEAVILNVEVSGDVQQLDKLLAWLETNDRLFRIDSLRIEPPRGDSPDAKMVLVLLALKVRP